MRFSLALLAFLAITNINLSNLNAIELSTICANSCSINTIYGEVTHHGTLSLDNPIPLSVSGGIDTFINYGTITNTGSNPRTFTYGSGSGAGYIRNFINYGTMGGIGGDRTNGAGGTTPMSVTNYGIMGGIDTGSGSADITINNYGIIGTATYNNKRKHLAGGNQYSFVIKNYAIVITKSATTFNSFSGDAVDNSQVVLDGGSMRFFDSNAKVILDFGRGFELGKEYKLNKLFVKHTGGDNALSVDFERLTARSDLYLLNKSGDSFVVNLVKDAKYSMIGNLYKSNIRTMNNFYTMSNSMIYPHKYSAKRNTNKRRVIRRVKKTANLFYDSWIASGNALAMTSEVDSSLRDESNENFASLRENERSEFSWQSKSHDFNQPQITMNQERINNLDSWIASSATLPRNDEFWDLESLESLQSNESFAYKSDSSDYYANNATNPNSTNRNVTRRRITTTNQTNPNSNPNANRTLLNQSNDKYYFILTPFVNHNLFFESGRYNLSGLEYGFLTAFSGKITPSNVLGAHFMMSYGSLGDSKDKNFSITNLNLNIGLNYKFDMIWDSYLKARGDFYYFLNQVKTLTIFEAIKPNNLGFGLSVAYGKDFNFGKGGTLGVEGGIDYKALQVSNIALQNSADRSVSEIYQKSLYNLIYVDLGLNYAKYFNTSVGLWGLNANMGIKGNVTANKLAKSQVRLNALNRNVDMTLDNDKILGYANLSGSYVLNAKDFNMEFSLAYYGNYGDRVVSNGGGVEMRVVF